MGQYYKACVENDEGTVILDSWGYGSGAKLMEHSWMGNDFVNAVYTLIENKPSDIGWVGDYSDSVGVNEAIYKMCWGEECEGEGARNVEPKDFFKNGEYEGFLVNYTKKQMIDMKKYAKLAEVEEGYLKGWIVNPLPLLTAIGNGQGGGDYRGENMEMVGHWYMDSIAFEHEPKDFADITEDAIFKEC